jgi:hypothetical protein
MSDILVALQIGGRVPGLLGSRGLMQCQAALLLWRLGRDEPYIRPGDRFTYRLGVRDIVLMPLRCQA